MVGESRRRDLVPVALVLSKIIINEKKHGQGKSWSIFNNPRVTRFIQELRIEDTGEFKEMLSIEVIQACAEFNRSW